MSTLLEHRHAGPGLMIIADIAFVTGNAMVQHVQNRGVSTGQIVLLPSVSGATTVVNTTNTLLLAHQNLIALISGAHCPTGCILALSIYTPSRDCVRSKPPECADVGSWRPRCGGRELYLRCVPIHLLVRRHGFVPYAPIRGRGDMLDMAGRAFHRRTNGGFR